MAQKIFCLLKDNEGDLEMSYVQAINEDEAIRKCIANYLIDYEVLLGIEPYEDCQPDEGDSDIEKLISDSESEHDDGNEETHIAKQKAHQQSLKNALVKLSTKDFKKRLELSHKAYCDCPRYTWKGEITVIV